MATKFAAAGNLGGGEVHPAGGGGAMLSIRELKALCARNGVDTATANERSDLVALALPFLPNPADTKAMSWLPAAAYLRLVPR